MKDLEIYFIRIKHNWKLKILALLLALLLWLYLKESVSDIIY